MLPWHEISTTFSPVYDFGEKGRKYSSSIKSSSQYTLRTSTVRCLKGLLFLLSFFAISVAFIHLSEWLPSLKILLGLTEKQWLLDT